LTRKKKINMRKRMLDEPAILIELAMSFSDRFMTLKVTPR